MAFNLQTLIPFHASRMAMFQDFPLVPAPANANQIEIVCPECGKGGIWAFPEGFQIEIRGTLFVTCSNGHQWGIYKAWAEEDHGRETDNRSA